MMDRIAPLLMLLLPLAVCLAADVCGWLWRRAKVRAENEAWFRATYQQRRAG